jgi:hypothetical protein
MNMMGQNMMGQNNSLKIGIMGMLLGQIQIINRVTKKKEVRVIKRIISRIKLNLLLRGTRSRFAS